LLIRRKDWLKEFVPFFLLACLVTTRAYASGKLGYGSRIGMTVTVISIQGLNTARAVIRTAHTRDDALVFCREYVGQVSDACIEEELARPLNDVIYGNCTTGVFSDFSGNWHCFEGKNKKKTKTDEDFGLPNYIIRDLPTGEIENGTSASGYTTYMPLFRALCPTKAPLSDEE
jgi:hypothetical protein